MTRDAPPAPGATAFAFVASASAPTTTPGEARDDTAPSELGAPGKSWTLAPVAFEAFARDALPPGHELHALVRASQAGTRDEDACALAHERIEEEPFPPELVASLDELALRLGELGIERVLVEARLGAEPGREAALDIASQPIEASREPSELGRAVREAWARATFV